MNIMFGGIALVCLFGSLSMFTPNLMWNDPTYFFRENKSEYLKFSNIFRGKYYLVIGIVSLVCFIISFFIKLNIHYGLIFTLFLICLLIGRIILEVKWNKHIGKQKLPR